MKSTPLLLGAAVAGFWLVLLWHLAPVWSSDPQYYFGWLFLGAGPLLLWRRWITRPAPVPLPARSRRWPVVLAMAAAGAFLPTWLLAQPNPDWRLVSWALGIEVLAISLCALHLAGGSAWSRHFGFPICLVLATLPWPSMLEHALVQMSARVVSAISVEGLNLLGVAAFARGNLIELANGQVAVDDACSGIRSLQATVFATLFIGELFRVSAGWRAFIFFAGVISAFVCNLGRAFLLGWIAATRGAGALEAWHDPAGFTILAISFALTWIIALRAPQARLTMTAGAALPPPARLPRFFAGGLLAWLCASLLLTEAWFRSRAAAPAVAWFPAWPVQAPQFERQPIPQPIAKLMRYDRGEFARWISADGEPWMAYFFRWNPGPIRSRQIVRSHKPEVCLPASGYHLSSGPRPLTIELGELHLPFSAYTFTIAGQPAAHIFHTVWRDHAADGASAAADEWSRSAAFRSVLARQRNVGQQVLELIVFSDEPASDVEARVRRDLPALIAR